MNSISWTRFSHCIQTFFGKPGLLNTNHHYFDISGGIGIIQVIDDRPRTDVSISDSGITALNTVDIWKAAVAASFAILVRRAANFEWGIYESD